MLHSSINTDAINHIFDNLHLKRKRFIITGQLYNK